MTDLAIVVSGPHLVPAAAEAFPGAKIVLPCQALAGRRFDRVMCLWNPKTKAESEWASDSLACRLARGGKILWLT